MGVQIKDGFIVHNSVAYPIHLITKVEEVGGVCEITFSCGNIIKKPGHLQDILDEVTKNRFQ